MPGPTCDAVPSGPIVPHVEHALIERDAPRIACSSAPARHPQPEHGWSPLEPRHAATRQRLTKRLASSSNSSNSSRSRAPM